MQHQPAIRGTYVHRPLKRIKQPLQEESMRNLQKSNTQRE